METYFIAGNGVNNRSGIDSRDTVVIDNKIRNSDGKCFTDLFEKVTDDEFVNKRQGFAYRSKSGNTIPKETWEWFWRNAIYYICYDAPTTKANMDQVYFYIDEQNSGASSSQVYLNPTALRNPILCTLLRIPVSISSL